MAIGIRSWMGLICAAEAVGLKVYEPPGRLDFFVYIKPGEGWTEDALRSNFHLHIFLESNIESVPVGGVVSFRIATILPKTAFAGGGERPNLANVDPDNWLTTVQNMHPRCGATEEAARLFAAAVKTQMTDHGNVGSFKAL